MYNPYEIDHDMSKENVERIARQVENHRALRGEQNEKAVDGVLAILRVTLAAVLTFVRGA